MTAANQSTLFYLGAHNPSWLWNKSEFPLFVSRNSLLRYKGFREASVPRWALDSGGFTELHSRGRWEMSPRDYAEFVLRCDSEIGSLDFAAPQDWMCEESSLNATGLSVEHHQYNTVENFLELRDLLGEIVIPVLQGSSIESYQRCRYFYESAGINLAAERKVGLGSVCRRQATNEIVDLARSLQPMNLHGFGVKKTGLCKCDAGTFSSVDSLAWSFRARRMPPLPGHEIRHKNCANCYDFAANYRLELISKVKGLL